mgnify:FL=1|jgi:hypothetical protein
MKTKLTLQQETYPRLMINKYTDSLVLFFKHREGVIIGNDNDNLDTEDTVISMHSSSWQMDSFSKLQGKQTIFFQPRDEYPKYRKCRSSEMIVLFHDEDEGIVINPNKKHDVGFYSRAWFQRDFEDAAGELIISN